MRRQGDQTRAVASSAYNTDGWAKGQKALGLSSPAVTESTQFFYIEGVCGGPRLNFFRIGDGFDYYANAGDGVLGHCVRGNGRPAFHYTGLAVYDDWVCYGSTCGCPC